jgi:hypothetical protein
VAIQVLAGAVVAHRGARVGVAGGDLDIAQVDACVTKLVESNVPTMSSSSAWAGCAVGIRQGW